jgi:hypothetical protein
MATNKNVNLATETAGRFISDDKFNGSMSARVEHTQLRLRQVIPNKLSLIRKFDKYIYSAFKSDKENDRKRQQQTITES